MVIEILMSSGELMIYMTLYHRTEAFKKLHKNLGIL